MKSKTIHSLLVPAVLLLWAIVAWRYLGPGLFKEPSENISSSPLPLIQEKSSFASYELLLDYRDPFLDGYSTEKSQATSRSWSLQPTSVGSIQKLIPKSPKPPLSYQGCIAKGNSQQKTAIVLIGKENKYLSLGDSLFGGQVSTIVPHSLEISLPDTLWRYQRQGL